MSDAVPVYIAAAKRTAIGSFGGSASTIPAPKLAAEVIQALVAMTGIQPLEVEEVILGCVLTAGIGQAPTRQAVIGAGLPTTTQTMTVNKVCSSGLAAVTLAAHEIRLGIRHAIVAGGMENMSLAPYLMPKLRNGARLGNATAVDSILQDGLWDVYNDFHMGTAAEMCASKYGLDREAQDAYALESYRRANEAIANGWFEKEIIPVRVTQGKQEIVFAMDEEPGKLKPEKISSLKPAFDPNGTVTAANASSLSDGAAALLVCSEEFLQRHNLTPIARIVEQGWHGQEPEWFTTAPIGAVQKVLHRAGRKLADVDLVELNEAFSAVALACGRSLEIDPAKLNVSGGAVALGHPIGASGARILVSLLHSLERLKKKTGIAAICNGGGEATSLLVEMV